MDRRKKPLLRVERLAKRLGAARNNRIFAQGPLPGFDDWAPRADDSWNRARFVGARLGIPFPPSGAQYLSRVIGMGRRGNGGLSSVCRRGRSRGPGGGGEGLAPLPVSRRGANHGLGGGDRVVGGLDLGDSCPKQHPVCQQGSRDVIHVAVTFLQWISRQ